MGQVRAGQNRKSGQEVAKHKKKKAKTRYARTDQRYWEARLYHSTYTRNGEDRMVSDWSVRIQFRGRRDSFNLKTANKAAASARARDIYLSLVAVGWADTLAEYKPAMEDKVESPTIGDFLAAIKGHASIEPQTLKSYAGKLRKIVAAIAGREGDKAKYDHAKGGNQKWIESIESIKLVTITPEKVRKWRQDFIDRVGDDRQKRKAATHTANSYIRNAKALFAPKHLETIQTIIELPEKLPFEGVKLPGGTVSRYKSEIDPELLLISACNELCVSIPREIDTLALDDAKSALRAVRRSVKGRKTREIKEANRRVYEIRYAREIAESKNEQFKILLLALGVGLRRREIDFLEWSSLLWDQSVIRIQPTRYFQPKTEDSEADIDVDPSLMEIFREHQLRAKDEFVINGPRPRPYAAYYDYRCAKHFNALSKWLRSQGIVSARSPLHSLRKEFGSQINKTNGIYAASTALRHSNIRTTRDSYLDKKERITYKIGHLLNVPGVTDWKFSQVASA